MCVSVHVCLCACACASIFARDCMRLCKFVDVYCCYRL